jgi:outer membrane protein TolC
MPTVLRKEKTKGLIFIAFFSVVMFPGLHGSAQQIQADSLLQVTTLPNVIQYALKRQPLVQQSLIDEKVTDLQIKTKLADWYPQVNFNYVYQRNFQVQTAIINGNLIKLGVENTSGLQFTGTQTIFNRDVLIANRTKGDVRLQTKQQTTSNKIAVVANVSKAFYDVLATQQQVKVANVTIERLERSLKDTRSQYDAGVVDKTDYKRATIALNNAKAQKKSSEELLKAKKELLKSLMNYPVGSPLEIQYDSAALEKETGFDTVRNVDLTKRIEYQLLQTQRKLLEANVQYNQWSFIPTLTANGAYLLNYQNNSFSKLYNQSYPNSYAGITLGIPIFQGGKRKYNIQQAEWQLKRTELDIVNLINSINAEFNGAMAGYKANYSNFLAVKENVSLAQEVYNVIQLQYRSGVKTYLDVITAETDLRTSQINYFNALYDVLSSKIDVEKSLGELQY